MDTRWLLTGVLAAAAVTAVAAHDGHGDVTGRTFKVGKKLDVNIGEDVKIGGGDVLKKGKYVFDHRIEDDRHVISLTAIVKNGVAAPVYDIPTTLIPARAGAKQSAFVARELADHSLRVGVIHVAGEALEHVPLGATVRIAATH